MIKLLAHTWIPITVRNGVRMWYKSNQRELDSANVKSAHYSFSWRYEMVDWFGSLLFSSFFLFICVIFAFLHVFSSIPNAHMLHVHECWFRFRLIPLNFFSSHFLELRREIYQFQNEKCDCKWKQIECSFHTETMLINVMWGNITTKTQRKTSICELAIGLRSNLYTRHTQIFLIRCSSSFSAATATITANRRWINSNLCKMLWKKKKTNRTDTDKRNMHRAKTTRKKSNSNDMWISWLLFLKVWFE